MCIFHLWVDYDDASYLEMNRYKKMTTSNELTIDYLKSEANSTPHCNSGTFFLDYESDLEVTASPP